MSKRVSWQGFIAAAIGEDTSFTLAQVILGKVRSGRVPDLSPKRAEKALKVLEPYLCLSTDGSETMIDNDLLRGLLRPTAENDSDEATVISKFFTDDLRLRKIPSRPTDRNVVFNFIVKRLFLPHENLAESQVNERLKVMTPDFVTLRRYLIDAGLLMRRDDGSSYQLNLA